MEWQAWTLTGVFTSREHTWDDLPSRGVLVVRVWGGPFGDTLSWGEAYYGHPDTWKMEGRLPDADFAAVLEEARLTRTRPSER